MNVCELSWRGWRPAVAAAAVALLLAGCFDRGERPAADAPGQPLAQCGAQAALVGIDHPSICLAYPASGAVSLSLGARPYLKFGRDMDAATLTAATFTLSGPGGLVEGTVAYDPQRRDAFFVPAYPLLGNATYVATLSADVQHSDGTGVAEYSWSFATGPATARHLYAANDDGTISVLAVDAASGALRHHTYFVPEDVDSIQHLTTSADGGYAFVAGSSASEASLWLVETDAPGSGARVPVPGTYVESAFVPVPGRSVGFVLAGAPRVLHHFSFTGGTWSPGEVIPLPDDGSGNPLFDAYDVVADPQGRYVALVGGDEVEGSAYVAVYLLDEAGRPAGPPQVLSVTEANHYNFYAVVAHPTGEYLYAIDHWGAGAIHTIQVGGDGQPTWDNLVLDIEIGAAPSAPEEFAFALHPSGAFAFVRRHLGDGATAIDTYAVDPANGALTPTQYSTETKEGRRMRSMAVDSSGRFLYASSDKDTSVQAQEINEIAVFSIGPDGSLTPQSIMAGRRWPTDLALVHGAAPLAYTTENAYVLSADVAAAGQLRDYGIDEQGSHGPLAALPLVVGLDYFADSPRQLALDPKGRALYVAGVDEGNGAVAMYRRGEGGALSELEVEGSHLVGSASAAFRAMAVDATGRFGYAFADGWTGLRTYDIAADGALQFRDVDFELPQTMELLMHPAGHFLYSFSSESGFEGIDVFEIDGATGGLSGASSREGLFADIFAFDASGRFLLGATEDAIEAFLVDPDTGLPSSEPGAVELLSGLTPAAIAAHPAGRFIYVLDSGAARGGDGVIHVLEFDPLGEQLIGRDGLLEAPSAGPLWSLHIDAAGQLLYVGTEGANGVGEVLVYRIGEDGGLTYLDTLTQGARPQVVTRTRVE